MGDDEGRKAAAARLFTEAGRSLDEPGFRRVFGKASDEWVRDQVDQRRMTQPQAEKEARRLRGQLGDVERKRLAPRRPQDGS